MITINNLIQNMPRRYRVLEKLLMLNESEKSLSHTRFVQDTATSLLPKFPFIRSKADLADTTFMEVSESLLVYYMPGTLGEKVFRKIFSRKLSGENKRMVSVPYTKLKTELEEEQLKKIAPVKAAIALATMIIPLMEFSLCYLKNLFTLKFFNQADFNNIANLNKDQNESKESQEKVKASAITNIKRAFVTYAGLLVGAASIAKFGKNSKVLQKVSEFVLAPGSAVFAKDKKKADFFNKYFSLDFSNDNGKLALSKGQLTSCVVIGGVGYMGSAKDRGKQNFLEVLFRMPIVGLYVITGNEFFDRIFKSYLKRKNLCQEVLDKSGNLLSNEGIKSLAEKNSTRNKTTVQSEFNKLFKQKATVAFVPFLFGILVIGAFVAGVSRFFTEYRYNKEQASKNKGGNPYAAFENSKSL